MYVHEATAVMLCNC